MNRVIGEGSPRTFIVVAVGIGILALAAWGVQAALTTGAAFGPVVAAPQVDEVVSAPREEIANALDASGLERDLKDVVREQIAAAPAAVDQSGLERDLKAVWRAQMQARANEEVALALDPSGLERDLKEVVREQMAAGPQEH